ncbi:HAD family hydrolase [candidate division KSB1 bacterium]|nr:HAD family hydrolase [candidate division KSB1 bacterium]
MKYYIFRNTTIEMLFSRYTAEFSGYGEIINFNIEADAFIWFYLPPIKPNQEQCINEIQDYYLRLELILPQIPVQKQFLIFTLENLFQINWQNSDFSVGRAIHEYNHKLYKLVQEYPNIKVVDFYDFINRYNQSTWIDWKFYYLSQMVINPKLADDFQDWLVAKINAIQSKRKKCLILDLDNTLWGGILGEDGLEGIKLGNSYPGKAYYDFQLSILEASKNGIILAVCSKNNENDVLEAWEKNPSMILKSNNFAAYRINWQNKAANILELAKELNIGLDSMVFIDDNPVERNLIRTTIPEVIVPEFPEQPYNLNIFFRQVYENYFQVHSLTNEDKSKTAQYLANAQRTQFQKVFTSLEDYFANLKMELNIQPATNFNIPRIAQMTQKTNQFNLTTKRYTETDIHQFLADKNLIWGLNIKDKFGDNGLTAACIVILDAAKKEANIDSFLLSCRILGRGIENAFLSWIINNLLDSGIEIIKATYLPTSKNKQVENFYEGIGFELLERNATQKNYQLKLTKKIAIKNYYKIRVDENETGN